MKLLLLAPALACAAAAAEPTADKSKYHLLNPTPKELMREMSTDRPDKTESPFTVDAGHFQIESELVSFSRDKDAQGVSTEAWSAAGLNLKAGLCNFSDVQLVLAPYNRVRIDDRSGAITRQEGFGDIETRLKVNLWGNDEGSTAMALMPFVKWPSSQDGLGNHAIEGGLIVPFGFELPAGFDSTAMTQVDWRQDSNSKDYHPEFINTITVGHELIPNRLSGYVEFFSFVSTEKGSDWVGTVDIGFVYGITKDMTLDFGINIGVTDSAEDWNPFLGFSIRF